VRVLLIDDDARLAELLDGNLRPQGVALVHSGGGQAGLAALAGGGFDAGAARRDDAGARRAERAAPACATPGTACR